MLAQAQNNTLPDGRSWEQEVPLGSGYQRGKLKLSMLRLSYMCYSYNKKTNLRLFSLKMLELMGKGSLCQLNKIPQAPAWVGLGSESRIRRDLSDRSGLREGSDRSRQA